MHPLIRLATAINPTSRSPLRRGFFRVAFAGVLFALSPQARAVCQEGCLVNFNTVLGDDALENNTSGVTNTAIGFGALLSNTTGAYNTATGGSALYLNRTGSDNTATGSQALLNNTTGNDNTAAGFNALDANRTGSNNTAIGADALFRNTAGNDNTATGLQALYSNDTGIRNTANGARALIGNVTGSNNTANGTDALHGNDSGNYNTANGVQALVTNSTGDFNTATGQGALYNNTTGSANTANGMGALSTNTTGDFNIAVGFFAGDNLTTGSNNIDIVNLGVAGESNNIRIGTQGTHVGTSIAGIYGANLRFGVPVFVNANGRLGTFTSSARFKERIEPMDKASEAILALKPVTFRYKQDIDPDGIPQFGLVAEEVEKVNPDLVVRDADGKPYTVRYEAVNAMLLNEFLKEHKTVGELEATVANLVNTVKEQAAQIEKVSAQLDANKPPPQFVLNNR
jgi:hypothetical protein